jgi:hypothetical protein
MARIDAMKTKNYCLVKITDKTNPNRSISHSMKKFDLHIFIKRLQEVEAQLTE